MAPRRWRRALLTAGAVAAVRVATAAEVWQPGALEESPGCGAAERDRWRRLRDKARLLVPRAAGRPPFAIFASDLAEVEAFHAEIAQAAADGALDAAVPRRWSECALAWLSARAVAALFADPADVAEAAMSSLVPGVLAVPWSDALLSGWPLFGAMATLARWASRNAEAAVLEAGGARGEAAARAVAALPASACDAAEAPSTRAARSLLSALWRRRDPNALEEDGGEEEAEAALAEEASAWGADEGGCRWTEHRGRYLGGVAEAAAASLAAAAPAPGGERLLRAMAACSADPGCAGVTGGRVGDEEGDAGVVFSARRGEPLLAPSPAGEASWVRWCPGAGCPFGRATALLARARRRLSRGGGRGVERLEPELLLEAQAAVGAWAAAAPAAGAEAWATQWPLWDVLAKLEQRVHLLVAEASLPPWGDTLQRATGLTDEAFRLALEELARLPRPDDDGERGPPAELRERVHCGSGQQCLAELYARLHASLHGNRVLPLRDPIFMQPQDSLLPLHMERSKAFMQLGDYDWSKLLHESRGDDGAERLDALMPGAHPLQVDRLQLANFVLLVREHVGAQRFRRCVEWDNPFLLVRAFQGACQWMDIFSYSERSAEDPMMGLPGRHEYTYGTRHYWGDLEHPAGLGIEPGSFGLILAPFVFEHISQPFLAMRTLAETLQPGGYLLWAAPMFQQYHGSPSDFYRYTPKGARALAQSAGLETVLLYAPGDLGLATGVLTGMMLPYWSRRQALAEEQPAPGEDSPRMPLNVFALFRKPLSDAGPQ